MYAPVFSPVSPHFRRRCAPLKVSLWRRMSADATGIFILTGDNALPLTAFALAFSPVNPLSENDGKTTGNRLRLTRFLPVNLVFVAAFAALGVSFPGTCPGKDGLLFGRRDNRQSPFSPRAPLSGRRGRQSSRFAELSLVEGECHCCFSCFARKTFRTSSLFTITYNFSLRAPLSFSRCVFAEQNELL